LHFRVSDTGPGIAPYLIATIFEPFTQERPSISQQYGGTGLGLAISKRLVAAMGGKLDVESCVGAGTTFSFRLWLTQADSADMPVSAEPLPSADVVLPQARVLLADDSPFNRLVVREFLRETACTIDEVENGLDAVQLYQQSGHDIVLMDMRMPQMNGIEAVRRIRLWEAEQHRKPALIIMLTASAFDSDRLAVLAAGCDEVLTKPVQKATLLRLLITKAETRLVTSA
jgi:CheY-like chemotaxis protein